MSSSQSSCVNCPVYLEGFLSKLSPESRAAIMAERCTIFFKKRQVVFYEGTPCASLFCLKSGMAKMVKSDGSRNRRKIIRFLKKGELLGYRTLVANEAYHFTVETLVDSEICVFPQRCLEGVLEEPMISAWMIKKLSSDLREAEDMERDLVAKSAVERLVDLLISLGEVTGDKVDASTRIQLVITRQEMAEFIGTTMETVVRILSEFQEKGFISIQPREILLKNTDALRAISSLTIVLSSLIVQSLSSGVA